MSASGNKGDFRYEGDQTSEIVETWRRTFARQRAFAEHAFDQLDHEGFFATPAPGLNSVGIITRHLAGNMLSRFTDFLSTDGEKPDRDRDSEFIPPKSTPESRRAIMDRWEQGWHTLDAALAPLQTDDLGRIVTIRGAPHSVHAAIIRQIDHYAFHIGQINVIARMHVGTDRWTWFTLPPGTTESFNAEMRRRADQNDQA